MAHTARAILVVDDDRELLVMLRRLLEHDGYRVLTADDAHSALEACERELPCLVFADLMMPKVDGETFLRELRLRLGTSIPPVVILSASALRDDVARRLGVAASIGKPFDLDDVREVVAQHCRDHQRDPRPHDEID